MPKATIEQREPLVRIPHKGDGYTLWTLAEAKELQESLAATIREVEHTALRVSVTWADDAVERCLRQLTDWRDGNGTVQAHDQAVLVAIDCLRTVLGKDD